MARCLRLYSPVIVVFAAALAVSVTGNSTAFEFVRGLVFAGSLAVSIREQVRMGHERSDRRRDRRRRDREGEGGRRASD